MDSWTSLLEVPRLLLPKINEVWHEDPLVLSPEQASNHQVARLTRSIESSRATTKSWLHAFMTEQCEIMARKQEMSYLTTLPHLDLPSDIILRLSFYLMRSDPWTPQVTEPALTCIIAVSLTFSVLQEDPELELLADDELVLGLERQLRDEHLLHRLARMMCSQLAFYNNRLAVAAKSVLHRHHNIFVNSWNS